MKELYDYCRRDQSSDITRLLEQDLDIDLTYKNGIYIRFAIKHNNIKILNSLLEYYEKTQLQGNFENQYAVPLARHKLQTILQDAVKSFDISEEMQRVLDNYIPKEEDSDLEQELGEIEDLMGFNFTKMNSDRGSDDYENNDHNLDLIGKANHLIGSSD